MKKVFTLVVAASVFSLVACGPSAEELAKKAQAVKDSLEKVRIDDSIAAEVAKMKDDSIAAVKKIEDSIAALPKKK